MTQTGIFEPAQARVAYSQAVEAGDVAGMLAHAQQLLTSNPSLAVAQQIANTLPAQLPGRAAVACRVAILRSFTIETTVPFLRALSRLYGIDLPVKVGEFNSYAQEIIDPGSWLYEFDPQIIVLAVQTRDVVPQLWDVAPGATTEDLEQQARDCVARFTALLDLLRSRTSAAVIVQNLELPQDLNAGILDARRPGGQAEAIRGINRELDAAALRYEGMYVLDYDALVSRHGRAHWTDERKWLTSRAPVASGCLIHLAREYVKFIVPICGRQAKVLVVDLDNTLWGGVIGEDGPDGIKLGGEYPGAAHTALQRAILNVGERGVLLAICSKNNEADALEALRSHAGMLLRPGDFAAMRINWNDKAGNLREIAAELNVGLDSLAFLDDNPVERQQVRLAVPEVTVIDLPQDPTGYAAALRATPVFERLAITLEDRNRHRFYAEQRERRQLESAAGSMEDFYRSLEMRAEWIGVDASTLARIAQLTQKTNQLNMTTRRYTESEVRELVRDPAWNLSGIRVIDRFGDNGIVGVMFVNTAGEVAEIDTFLLSCRVIGRTVETAMLARACAIAVSGGCKQLAGWFLPTKKNAPAAGIFSGHGFVAVEQTDSGTRWQLDLAQSMIQQPEWIA